MNNATPFWLALIGCYAAIIALEVRNSKRGEEVTNHLRSWLREELERARHGRERIFDKLDELSGRVSNIEGKLED